MTVRKNNTTPLAIIKKIQLSHFVKYCHSFQDQDKETVRHDLIQHCWLNYKPGETGNNQSPEGCSSIAIMFCLVCSCIYCKYLYFVSKSFSYVKVEIQLCTHTQLQIKSLHTTFNLCKSVKILTSRLKVSICTDTLT